MKDWKTTLFGALAAAGIFAHQAGVFKDGTNAGNVASAVTAVSVAVAGWSAKDKNGKDKAEK